MHSKIGLVGKVAICSGFHEELILKALSDGHSGFMGDLALKLGEVLGAGVNHKGRW